MELEEDETIDVFQDKIQLGRDSIGSCSEYEGGEEGLELSGEKEIWCCCHQQGLAIPSL